MTIIVVSHSQMEVELILVSMVLQKKPLKAVRMENMAILTVQDPMLFQTMILRKTIMGLSYHLQFLTR